MLDADPGEPKSFEDFCRDFNRFSEQDRLLRDARRGWRYVQAPYDPVLDLAYFVLLAAASGVCGNLAYDAVRKLWRRTKPSKDSPRAHFEAQLTRLSLEMVTDQCLRHGIEVPTDMRVGRWDSFGNSTTVVVESGKSSFSARVEFGLPAMRSGAKVHIVSALPDEGERSRLREAALREVYPYIASPRTEPPRPVLKVPKDRWLKLLYASRNGGDVTAAIAELHAAMEESVDEAKTQEP